MHGDLQGTPDRAREERLVRDHLRLVDNAVNHLSARLPRHVGRDDLVSAGMAALAQAARSFDAARDTDFSHYASVRIRGGLLDELRSRDWASRSVRAKARRVAAATEQLTAELGRTPTTDELAAKAGLSASTVARVASDVHRSVVLNYESISAAGGGELTLPPDEQTPDAVLLERERRAYLVDAVSALPARLRRVVVGYYFEERSMQELAAELGVSASRVSQMRAEAAELLRDGITAQLDPDHVSLDKGSRRVARRTAAYRAAVATASDFKARLTVSAPAPAWTSTAAARAASTAPVAS